MRAAWSLVYLQEAVATRGNRTDGHADAANGGKDRRGTIVWLTVVPGPPPLRALLDPIIWLVYAVVGAAGAFSAISAVLALRHLRESPRWLWGTLAGLVLFSQPVVSGYVHESREMERFLATADSTGGVVAHKFVRGGVNLVVEYQAGGQPYHVRKTGANPFVGTPAFTQWRSGDSIPVYYQPTAPDSILVGHCSPERRILFESLAKVWIVWGVLLTAYLPLIARWLRGRLVVGPFRPRTQAP